MPKPAASHIDPAEQQKIIRAAMEWMIDDFPTADIITKITTTWHLTDAQAKRLLADARQLCANDDELQEQILSRRIEGIKKMKRGMNPAEKKTAFGISVLLNLDNNLLRLETVLQSLKDRKKANELREANKARLTDKQILFCLEYLKDKNGTQAAIKAGFSARTAKEQAYRMLNTPHIKVYIADLLEEQRRQTKVDADMALDEMIALANWNIQDFISDENTIVDLKTLPKAQTKPVVGIKSSETITKDGEIKRVTELKLVDKRAAWVDVNRHFGNFKDDNEQKTIKIKVTRK